MDRLFLFIGCFGLGFFSLYLGIGGLLGYRRKSYILPFEYGYVGAGISYSMIPMGIACIIFPFSSLFMPKFESLALVITNIAGLISFIGILFGVFQPKFMMPMWYRWLRTNHNEIMPYLREDVERRGYEIWREQTDTQEGLEAWVAEVREKNNLPDSGIKLSEPF